MKRKEENSMEASKQANTTGLNGSFISRDSLRQMCTHLPGSVEHDVRYANAPN